jgi:hypothetical protein
MDPIPPGEQVKPFALIFKQEAANMQPNLQPGIIPTVTMAAVANSADVSGLLVTDESGTTTGSNYGGSRSSQGQDTSVNRIGGGNLLQNNDGGLIRGLPSQQQQPPPVTPKNQGLEKLQAYVLSNDENIVSAEGTSCTRNDEEFSLHLSRPTGTGSVQLALWIREVNLAVSPIPPPFPLRVETDDKTIENSIVSSVFPKAKPASSPKNGQTSGALSPANRNVSVVFSTPSKSSNFHLLFDTHSIAQSITPSKKKENRDVKALWHERCLAEKQKANRAIPPKSSKTQESGSALMKVMHASPSRSTTTAQDSDSGVMLAKIEGKYKSIRQNLVRDPTLEESTSSDDESTARDDSSSIRNSVEKSPKETSRACRSRRRSDRIHATVSAQPSREAQQTTPRRDLGVRDHFSLGMLSTRTSGILSVNSITSSSSFESIRSELSYTGGEKGGGCGLFLCD